MANTTLQKLTGSRRSRGPLAWLDWLPQPSRRKPPESIEVETSKASLDKLIEAEIIPRLMLVHQGEEQTSESPLPGTTNGHIINCEDVDAFARKAISLEPEILVKEAKVFLNTGNSQDDILLKLLAPAARRLGEFWEDDSFDFADVTLGLMKLQRVLESVGAVTTTGIAISSSAPRILLTTPPNETHTFGVALVGEFFARSGWRVQCEPNVESGQLIATVSEHHFDIVGISAFKDIDPKALKSLINDVRNASANTDIKVFVGGRIFNEDPSLMRRVKADAMATDGVRAVVAAERLLRENKRVQVTQ